VSQARSIPIITLGATLERDRLERRVIWMTVATESLRRRAEHRHEPPLHLRQAIAGFEAQIAAMNARLVELVPGREPTQVKETSA
jgi:hypothetical protein